VRRELQASADMAAVLRLAELAMVWKAYSVRSRNSRTNKGPELFHITSAVKAAKLLSKRRPLVSFYPGLLLGAILFRTSHSPS
jgi:hypothetical protein